MDRTAKAAAILETIGGPFGPEHALYKAVHAALSNKLSAAELESLNSIVTLGAACAAEQPD